ncbi:M20/M25/M40 family metallo-hydrolase [Geopsychrobacter electrodiphilus]|uniref:M20/M25/M40 family metallo-hydrolase n=1 Tax=Geopsychrobacter electrodiphilus TaxID=225196 RepID=UPI0003721397|nr:M20/M25/M40 family metallo-hydrolase [Geopsychrobacter electrodiphilus]
MINSQRLSDEFARQATIESPSFKEAGMADYLRQRFAEFGATLQEDQAAAKVGGQCNNLIFRLAGKNPGAPLLLSAHMDTVGPTEGLCPVLENGVFRSAGNTILGADDKSGIVEIIEALEVLREQQIEHVPLEIAITVCEEVGLLGAKNLDYSLITAKRGLALDTTGINIVIHKAPAANRFRIEITGQEAHAGVVPENGISAIIIAARAISRMRLGRIDDETTANIGIFNGGQATNIIPRQVILEGEVRSHDPQKLKQFTEEIIGLLEEEVNQAFITIGGKEIKAQMALNLTNEYPSLQIDKQSDILQLIGQAAEAINYPLQVKAAGGGSDANIFNDHGIETVILGTGMNKVHSVEEEVRVDDMVQVAGLLVEIIRRA